MRRFGSTPLSVLLIAVPGMATAWPRKTVRGSAARNSIERFNSSKYFIAMALELDAHAGARMRILRRVPVVVDIAVAHALEAEARLTPDLARVGAHRLLVVLDDESDRQRVVAAVLDRFVGDAALGVISPMKQWTRASSPLRAIAIAVPTAIGRTPPTIADE